MRARTFKATPVPSIEGRGPSDTISQAELVALVASRVGRDTADDEGTVRNRVRSTVRYAVRHDQLLGEQGRFKLGDVARWASSKWLGRFDDLPKDEIMGHLESQIGPITANAGGHVLPARIEEAHQEIDRLHDEIAALRRELDTERAQMRELEPDAKKWRDWIKKKGRPQGR